MHTEVDIPKTLASLKEVALSGFAIALHLRFTTPTYLFQTYPPAWIEEYGRDGLVMSDPTVAWGFTESGTITWGELEPRDSAGVIARAKAHGLNHGITIGLERDGSRSIASFSRPDRDFSPEEVSQLQLTVTKLHEATASAQPLPQQTREMLKRLSVAFTHP